MPLPDLHDIDVGVTAVHCRMRLVLAHSRAVGTLQPAFHLVQREPVVRVAVGEELHRTFAGRSLWLEALLGLILGGTLGNLIDRVRQGYVTDFVSVGFGSVRFPTFNVADSAISGAILLSPPLRFSAPDDLATWADSGRPLVALVLAAFVGLLFYITSAGIVGINRGRPFSTNPCLAAQEPAASVRARPAWRRSAGGT